MRKDYNVYLILVCVCVCGGGGGGCFSVFGFSSVLY